MLRFDAQSHAFVAVCDVRYVSEYVNTLYPTEESLQADPEILEFHQILVQRLPGVPAVSTSLRV